MIPEISASKVAGLIGLHKYQNATEVMYDLLCKDKDLKAKINDIEKANNRRPFNKLVNEVLKDGPVRDCVFMGIRSAQTTSDVSAVLNEVEQQAKMILDLRRDNFSTELRDRIAEEVRGAVSKQRGINNENTILNSYEVEREVAVTDRNTKTLRKDFTTFKLIGRTDGFVAAENRIVDSKERTRFWDTVPLYDEIQLRVYMAMSDAKESELIERFPDGKSRHTKFINDPKKWASLHAGIEAAVAKMNLAATDPEELKRIVFANSVVVS